MAREKYFEFLTFFVNMTDPRVDRGKNHKLEDVIGLALCGIICGADTWVDVERLGVANEEWFRQYLELPQGIPSHDTLGRIFCRLDVQSFQSCIGKWVEHLQFCLKGQTVAIDGKTVGGACDKAKKQQALHLVSAWASQVNFCLGQVSVDSKSNEIPAVRELLEILQLKGAVVTADAMHCQKETAAAVIEKEANYIFQVKENQPRLLESIQETFAEYETQNYESPEVRSASINERNRTREESRTCMVAPAPAHIRNSWKGARTIGLIARMRRLSNGTEQTEISYFLSSLPPRARQHAVQIRQHWSIENTLHHTLDVTFTEDRSRIRKGHGQEMISVFRRFALSILKNDTTIKDNIRGKRRLAGWNVNYVKGILLALQAN